MSRQDSSANRDEVEPQPVGGNDAIFSGEVSGESLDLIAGESSSEEMEEVGMELEEEEEEDDGGAVGEEEEDDETSRNLREALETLGLECGGLSSSVRGRVLEHVGGDLSRAIDWIMDNPDLVVSWESQPVEAPAPPSVSTLPSIQSLPHLRVGVEVQTRDGKLGHITAVHADGTVDMDLPGLASRTRVPAGELVVGGGMAGGGARRVPEQEEEEEEDDFGRLLGHLRDFTDLAAMAGGGWGAGGDTTANMTRSLAAIAAAHLGAAGAGAGDLSPQGSATAVGGIRVGTQVMLSHDFARFPESARGPLRAGEVGEVVQMSGGHVSVRCATNGRRWWYDAASIVEVPDKQEATPQDDVATIKDCTRANTSSHVRAVRRTLLRLRSSPTSGALGDLQSLCAIGLMEAIQTALLGEASGMGGEQVLGVLQLVELIVTQLFVGSDLSGGAAVGDWVTVKPGEKPGEAASGDGVVTDDLGMGEVCVAWAEGGRPSRVARSRTSRKNRGMGSRGGVVGYLNELLITRAVPNGDAAILQRVLADGASVEHSDSEGNTALILAAAKGSPLDFLNVLLTHGANIHAKNDAGRCALTEAAENGHTETVKRLIQAGARPPPGLDKDKCSEEVWACISEALPTSVPGEEGIAPAQESAGSIHALQERFVDILLPACALLPHSMSSSSSSADLTLRFVSIILTCMENLPACLTPKIVKGMPEWDHSCFRAIESMLACGNKNETLQGLRLVRALLTLQPASLEEFRRSGIHLQLPAFVATAESSQIRVVPPPPPPPPGLSLIAHAAASSPPPPRTRAAGGAELATPFGVAMVAEDVKSLMPAAKVSCPLPEEVSLSALADKISAGNEEAACQLASKFAGNGREVTAHLLASTGCIHALSAFLLPPATHVQNPSKSGGGDPNLQRRRALLLLEVLGGPGGTATAALIRCLNLIIATREALPIHKHGMGSWGGSGGLTALLEPHRVQLSPAPAPGQGGEGCDALSVLAEPIVTVSQLSRQILRTSHISHESYETFCTQLIGSIIHERTQESEDEGVERPCYRAAHVVGFHEVHPLRVGVHKLHYLDEVGGTADVVLAVRDYNIGDLRKEVLETPAVPQGCGGMGGDGDEGNERVHSVMVTYPHEAVPMDLFIDSVMGSVLQALRQGDPGQAPNGKNEGDEYDFPSRGFPDGQPEFHENLTRGLSAEPFTAAVARGQTRREAQVLLSRLDGLCEARLAVDRSRSYMPRVQEGPRLTPGTRIHCKHSRRDWASATILSCIGVIGAARECSYTVVYDDGEVCEGVGKGSIKDSTQQRRSERSRALGLMFGRALVGAGGSGSSDDTGAINPAALSRTFASFLRKGQESIPNRYDLTTGAGIPLPSSPLASSSNNPTTTGKLAGMRIPPVLQVAFAMDTRSASRPAAAATWHGVALSSQQRTLYELSNNCTTARKAERDAYVDTLRSKEPVAGGAQRYRLRIDAVSGEDFCNHAGFVAGEGYKGSALNSTDSCCVEVDSGRLSVDGRATGQHISRPPVAGDVLVLEVDTERGEFAAGIEGEAITTVPWTPTKSPLFLAVSFRRLGWQVTVLSMPSCHSAADIDEAKKQEEASRAALTVLAPPMTIFQAMQKIIEAAPGSVIEAAGRGNRNSKRPYELLYEIRVFGNGGLSGDSSFEESAGNNKEDEQTKLFQIMDDMDRNYRSPSLLMAAELDLSREEARWHVSNPNIKEGCRLPFPALAAEEAAQSLDKVEFVKRVQAVATPDWQKRMGFDSSPEEVSEHCSWELLHMLYRHLCGAPVTATVEGLGFERWQALSYQPFLSDQLDTIGLDAESRSAVILLWLLARAAPLHPSCAGEGIPAELLANKRLNTRLLQQLDDSLSIASGTLPAWCSALTTACPFLFDITCREKLVRYTAFGISHAMHWLQEEQVEEGLQRRLRDAERAMAQVNEMTGEAAQRAYDRLMVVQEAIDRQRIGGLKSDIARVQRGEDLLSQAERLMQVHASVTRMLEVQFVGEHGFGWGVTQGFYTTIALELQRRTDPVPTWRPTGLDSGDSNSPTGGTQYLEVGKEGLFIRPLHARSPEMQEACDRFRFLGRLMAKAFRDGFTVPLPLSPAFFALFRGDPLGPKDLPPGGLAGGCVRLLGEFDRQAAVISTVHENDVIRRISSTVGDMACTVMVPEYAGPFMSVQNYILSAYGEWPAFVDPEGLVLAPDGGGDPVELCPGGASRHLSLEEGVVREFVSKIVDLWLGTGVQHQMEAFRQGVNEVFSVSSLLRFSPMELQRLFCGHQAVVWTAYLTQDWLIGTAVQEEDEVRALTEHITPVGRLTRESPLFLLLVSELASMPNDKRAAFLDFVTATPRLPPGGLPKAGIKVATRTSKIVWSQTCIRTLYLPEVETAGELRGALDEAFANAALGGFHEQNLSGAS